MPKAATKQTAHGNKKKSNDGGDAYRLPKASKKLPPLQETEVYAETQSTGEIGEPILENSSNDSVSITGKKAETGGKGKSTSKRRTGLKQGANGNSTSNSQKRIVGKQKNLGLESGDSQPKPKPRKKVAVKVKPPDKLLNDVETDSTETNSLNAPASPQWTNIVKKSQIHKPSLKNKTKLYRKKDLSRRKRSDYVIENTWLPRNPADNINSQKPAKKFKSTKVKTRESQKAKQPNVLVKSRKTEDNLESEHKELTKSLSTTDIDVPQIEGQEELLETNVEETAMPDSIEAIISVTATRPHSASSPTKMSLTGSSPSLTNGSRKISPKLNSNRETTQVRQINVADFAKLNVQVVESPETTPTTQNVTDYQNRVSKVRFKGASNSVPNSNERQENIIHIVAQNDALFTTTKQTKKRKDNNPAQVSKVAPKSPPKNTFLLPSTAPQRNQFMDMLIGESHPNNPGTPEPLPRINYGSPIPLAKASNGSDDEMGEISIVVPRLPQLNGVRTHSYSTLISGGESATAEELADDMNNSQQAEEKARVIVTNENGVATATNVELEHDGWESGYNSMTPRLSIDSRAHAVTPMSGVMAGSAMLEIPNDHRSLTPFSTITTSTYLDHSRPQSTFLDLSYCAGEALETNTKKHSMESRPSTNKLPAIRSRNDDTEPREGPRLDFTPLPLQSIRTSDGELSD